MGDRTVRAVAISATDGLTRGISVINTRRPLSVPVGSITLGRIFNVLGEPIEIDTEFQNYKSGEITTVLPIHRSSPAFAELDTELAIFETGIKVVDVRRFVV